MVTGLGSCLTSRWTRIRATGLPGREFDLTCQSLILAGFERGGPSGGGGSSVVLGTQLAEVSHPDVAPTSKANCARFRR